MARSTATTVDGYLAELPPERREVGRAVRDLVLAHLPDGYVEGMSWGMIAYEIPLARYPDTYNGQPLGYAAIAAQKNHYALYLSCVYADPAREQALRDAYAAAGRRLDIGKSCLRFRRLDDLVPEAIGRAIASATPEEYIEMYERSRE